MLQSKLPQVEVVPLVASPCAGNARGPAALDPLRHQVGRPFERQHVEFGQAREQFEIPRGVALGEQTPAEDQEPEQPLASGERAHDIGVELGEGIGELLEEQTRRAAGEHFVGPDRARCRFLAEGLEQRARHPQTQSGFGVEPELVAQHEVVAVAQQDARTSGTEHADRRQQHAACDVVGISGAEQFATRLHERQQLEELRLELVPVHLGEVEVLAGEGDFVVVGSHARQASTGRPRGPRRSLPAVVGPGSGW